MLVPRYLLLLLPQLNLMLLLSHQFVLLCFSLNIDVVDLEWSQQKSDPLVVSADVLAYNHVKEEFHVIHNVVPKLFCQHKSV